MSKKLAVLVGFIGKLPYAGMSLWNIHCFSGLQDLGYEVHYVEHQDYPDEYYDPATDVMSSDLTYAMGYIRELLPRYGICDGQFSFVDLEGRCFGSGWTALRGALDRADFVLTVGSASWFDELERCPRRAFLDSDPMFTQVEMIEKGFKAEVLRHYQTLFTEGMRIGMPDCTIPDAGRSWIPTRSPIATRLWPIAPTAAEGLPVTALLHWAAGSDVIYDGRVYGHKNREFERFMDLPRHTSRRFTLAVGGPAPKRLLTEIGWQLVSPLEVTRTIPAYRKFIAESRADFGIAKHAYVASRSGWFSDRSTCYLASGRPVLHQDTGFDEWLPTGEGVLKFSDVNDVVECLRSLDLDYERHARAARRIAEEYFEASTVLGQMLESAGLR